MFAERTVWCVAVSLVLLVNRAGVAQPLIPGTGVCLTQVGDDFEDPQWQYFPNLPKSSEEQDEQQRLPGGRSQNGRWYEGIKRGTPDVVRRVPTPAGGLPGSEGALLLQTLRSGLPERLTYQMQQDDFVCNVWQRVGYKIPVTQSPSVVVRVFMPPINSWENRTGPTFGFRVSLETRKLKVPEDAKWFNKRPQLTDEQYWPGMFVELQSESDPQRKFDTANWRIRGNSRGGDFAGPQITETGWWTVGISITPDGQVHYYIKKGTDDLTAEDYVTSQFPYGYKAETFKTFFFNVCNRDDGRTWSTGWIVDDPKVYLRQGARAVAQNRSSGAR